MAVIISPYVGDARGKLGAGVYLRSKGQTVVRGYNPSPLNRRTTTQQGQRSTFGAAVKFYSRGVQNLFNFAFENKSPKESDYNAFMRYNAKIGPYWGPEQMADDLYPSIAPWVMSRGSLQAVGVLLSENEVPRVVLTDVDSPTGDLTIGDVSAFLISNMQGVQEGDILTFVHIIAFGEPGDIFNPWVQTSDNQPVWVLGQLVINSDNPLPFQSIGGWSQSGLGSFSFWVGSREFSGHTSAACCVHSRIINGKLLVSDTVLQLGPYAQEIYEYSRSYGWYSKVMEAWKAESKSILQGQVSEQDTNIPDGSVVSYVNLPGQLSVFGEGWIKIGGRYTRSKLAGGAADRGLVLTTEDFQFYLRLHNGSYQVFDGQDGFNLTSVTIKYVDNATLVRLDGGISTGGPTFTDVKFYPW